MNAAGHGGPGARPPRAGRDFAPGQMRRLEAMVAASAILFAAIFIAAAALTGGGQAWHALQAVPASVLPWMLALSSLNYVLRMLRWSVFAAALDVVLPWRQAALYYLAGFAMTTTPGKLGEAVRLWLINRSHGHRYRDTLVLLVVDRLADAQAMAVVALICAGGLAAYLPLTLAAIFAVGALSAVFMFPTPLLRLVGLAYRATGVMPRLFVSARRILRPLARLRGPRVMGLTLLLGICGWFAEGFSLHLVLQAMGVVLPASTAIFIFAFAMIVGALSFLPGGLGSTEATMIGLLTLAHVTPADALVATAIVRATTLWFAVAIGTIALPLAMRHSGRMAAARNTDGSTQ